MSATRNEMTRTSMKIGAVMGGMVFLLFGIVPAFHYGGYTALMLISKIVGGPVEATLVVRMLLVMGVLLGIACMGALSIVLGSVFGTVAGVVANAFSSLGAPAASEAIASRK
jgi:hypothetical protein